MQFKGNLLLLTQQQQETAGRHVAATTELSDYEYLLTRIVD